MSANPNARNVTVTVDGPTFDLGSLLVDVVKKLASGEKPAQVAGEEIAQAMAVFSQAGAIATDASLDRASVENALGLKMAELVDALLTLRAKQSPK